MTVNTHSMTSSHSKVLIPGGIGKRRPGERPRGLMSSSITIAAGSRATHKNLYRQEKQSRSPNKTSRSQEQMIFIRMMFMVLESPNAELSRNRRRLSLDDAWEQQPPSASENGRAGGCQLQ